MKNLRSYHFLTAALAAGIVVGTGCNQLTENKQIADKAGELTEVSNVNESKSGCCGKCSAEQNEQVASESGCSGKCGCAAENAAVSSETEGAVITCENGCNACAEGNSANCKCGDTLAEKQSEDTEGDVSAHVNSMPEDRDIFHYLLEHHEKITRKVEELDNGVQTVTESTDPVVTAKIQEHVASMYKRVEDGRPLRMWDELYREIFKHADKIKMEIKDTENGISVTETSDDEYVVKLIKSHAKVVTGFSEKGFDEARLNHEPPTK